MAKPQLENGYFKMANELRQAFARIRIAGEAMQVLWVIIGKTYGFNKKSDLIALSQFVEETGLTKAHICHAINKLQSMNIVVAEKGKGVSEKGNAISKYMLNKDFDTWKPLPKKVTLPKKEMGVAEKGNLPLPIKGHTKDNATKDRNKDTMAHPLLVLFGQLFEERFKSKYIASFDVDTKMLKDVAKVIGEEETAKRLRRFFEDDDDFLRKAGHKIGLFKKQVNNYCDAVWEKRNRSKSSDWEIKDWKL